MCHGNDGFRRGVKPFAMTVENACRHAGIKRTKMMELIKQGLVESVAEPRRLVIVESLERYIASRPRNKASKAREGNKGASEPGEQ